MCEIWSLPWELKRNEKDKDIIVILEGGKEVEKTKRQ